ncbi:MAG: FKBP-type peptidyl-prolyl cis-trans isomerase [Bacteroidota bacterium]
MAVKKGDTVKIHYTGKLESGEVFDSSKDREPLEFTVGTGQVIPGFENGILGMDKGETKTVEVPVDEGYGSYRDDLIFEIAKSELPPDIDPSVGERLQMQNDQGQVIGVTVSKVTDDTLFIDANHPLAGKDLEFDIELIDVK